MIPLGRKECIERRKSLSWKQREKKEKAIVEKLLPFLKGNIAAYVPIKGEVNIFDICLESGTVYLPKMIENYELEFIPYTGDLVQGSFQTQEPVGKACDPNDLDVIIVPMVSFCGLHRKGYGKGYYDCYLKKTNALKIGVAFDVQEEEFESQPHDIDMDILITESKLWRKE